MGNNFSVDNPVVQDYALYSSILIGKMMLMAPITGMNRMITGASPNPEDVKFYSGGKNVIPRTDASVERVRRAHLNDVENIPAFIFVSGLYILTNPDPKSMNVILKTYTISRIAHTAVYAFREVPQPTRGACYMVGEVITFYLVYKVIRHFL